MIENRTRILLAAARVYAQHGWRGATTRRIADEAGVNEVTIFRPFGSKDALLDAVMRECGMVAPAPELPAHPNDPEAELTEWAAAHHSCMCNGREMVRKMMGEVSERPDVGVCAAHGPSGAAAQLREYIVRLRRTGLLQDGQNALSPADVAAGVAMLMGALFADAMGRDVMPDLFPSSPAQAVDSYVRLFLRALGATQSTATIPASGS
jgi:AcrR family transcriptional regulator